MKNKIINLSCVLFIFLMIIMPLSSASVSTLGIFKQGECINLIQTCSSCTYNNITSILSPNSTIIPIDSSMIQSRTTFDYVFCNTTESGTYQVNGIGDLNGVDTIWNYNFVVTSTGKQFVQSDVLVYIFFLLVCLTVTIFSVRLLKSDPMEKDKMTSGQLYEMKQQHELSFYFELLKKKMWIVGVFGVYLSGLLFLSLLNQLVFSLGLGELNGILNIVIIILGWGLIPFILFWIGYIIIFFYKSTEEIMKHQFGGFRR
jgi:hypothetical protein